jgi:hypothetical protein
MMNIHFSLNVHSEHHSELIILNIYSENRSTCTHSCEYTYTLAFHLPCAHICNHCHTGHTQSSYCRGPCTRLTHVGTLEVCCAGRAPCKPIGAMPAAVIHAPAFSLVLRLRLLNADTCSGAK